MYKITQNEKQPSNFLGFKRKDKTTVHEFDTYKEALIFALNEQQPFFYNHIDRLKTSRKTFERYLTCKQFEAKAILNPLHYTGTNNAEKLDLNRLYYYYVNSGNLHRIENFSKIQENAFLKF
tara:strand:+ start:7098 stop:7463 length:366 start_codon:yes stop_codon:yes gene_type:complete